MWGTFGDDAMFGRLKHLLEDSRGSYRTALAEFSKSLTLIADLDQLQENVIGKVREIATARNVHVFLLNQDPNRFELVESRGIEETVSAFHFLPDEPLVRWFGVNETWLSVRESPEVFEYFSEKEQAALRELDIRLIFPLFVMNRVTGLVCLGPKEQENVYSREEIELLNTLLGQAAFAFENAWLAEQQKSRLRKMYRADRLANLGQLAAGAAHEIRNPLTSIRSTIQYLLKDVRDDDMRELVNDLLGEVDRIDGIIEGLLSFARSSEPQRERFDLRHILEQTIGLVSTTARKRTVTIALEFAPGESMIFADPAQLKQVFLNIIMNAVQAMEHGGALTITAETVESADQSFAPRRSFRISFQDTGIGIRTSEIDHVFDPFFTTKRDGTGLGLSISYGIIRQHGGEIEIESASESEQPGHHGTIVKVKLPLS
jgi:two-component system, NtrC family, sensor kinase